MRVTLGYTNFKFCVTVFQNLLNVLNAMLCKYNIFYKTFFDYKFYGYTLHKIFILYARGVFTRFFILHKKCVKTYFLYKACIFLCNLCNRVTACQKSLSKSLCVLFILHNFRPASRLFGKKIRMAVTIQLDVPNRRALLFRDLCRYLPPRLVVDAAMHNAHPQRP